MFISLYQEYESETPQLYRSELMVLFKRTPALREKVTRREGNTLEKALNKIGREDIVKQCIFNVELVTDDIEKAVARVRLDQPGFDSLKEELGPSRNTSLRRDATMDPKMDPDYEEPDRMKHSEYVEDLRNTGDKKTTKQHATITNGTVYNATSTPIKNKYASDEKDLGDMMADFIENKYHTADTMVKKSRDEIDDDNKKRQRVLADANKIVSDITQEAAKRAQILSDHTRSLIQTENDFLQQSEPSFMETITTETSPDTHERITRVTRTITSSVPITGEDNGENDDLRESMKKMVDQFMVEERKSQ